MDRLSRWIKVVAFRDVQSVMEVRKWQIGRRHCVCCELALRTALREIMCSAAKFLFSNPAFARELMPLVRIVLAITSLPVVIAVLLFWVSANAQIRSEDHVLETALGAPYLTNGRKCRVGSDVRVR
jgi:hypothetical protein